MRRFFFALALLGGLSGYAQAPSTVIDTLYLEDQFNIGISYNWLISSPSDLKQHNFSRTLFGGYQRDIPLNKKRNIGLAMGAGYSYSLTYMNLQAKEQNGDITYAITSIKDQKIKDCYYEQHSLDLLPLEFRWRTSTPYSHKFWRVYTGLKASYVFASNYKFRNDAQSYHFSDPHLKGYTEWKLYTAVGHNTWNIYIQYAFRPLLKGLQAENGASIESQMLNIGLIFYIL